MILQRNARLCIDSASARSHLRDGDPFSGLRQSSPLRYSATQNRSVRRLRNSRGERVTIPSHQSKSLQRLSSDREGEAHLFRTGTWDECQARSASDRLARGDERRRAAGHRITSAPPQTRDLQGGALPGRNNGPSPPPRSSTALIRIPPGSRVPGRMSGKPAARLSDKIMCPVPQTTPAALPHAPTGLPIMPPCAPTVKIGGQFAARMGDQSMCVGARPYAKSDSTRCVSRNHWQHARCTRDRSGIPSGVDDFAAGMSNRLNRASLGQPAIPCAPPKCANNWLPGVPPALRIRVITTAGSSLLGNSSIRLRVQMLAKMP